MSIVSTHYRTAESVSPKHPDKICDQISDAVLDAHLAEDPEARVAVDVAGGHGKVFVTGEVTSRAVNVDVEAIVKRLAGENTEVINHLVPQSTEIAQGVDIGGAGDQGIMIGYATDETPELLPLEVVLARRLNQFIYEQHPYDGKTQITLDGDKIVSVVASFQNVAKAELEQLVHAWIEADELAKAHEGQVTFHINPAGDWVQGGFDADAGLTGRKLAVDSYGPRIPIGGGAFSGKDPSKVDRSAAYAARRIAVRYLKERKAHEVFVRVAYAIGVVEPLEQTVIVDGVAETIEGFDLTPNGIIAALDLKRPIYEQTARYGHFGHGFDWDS
jgi:S-adenosylmethionine synthetase